MDQVLVTPRVEMAQGRVVDRRRRVALAPDDDVGPLGLHDRDEGGEELGGDVAIGVDEAEIPPPPHRQTLAQRVALAHVIELEPAHDAFGEALEGEGTAVGGAVRHGDDLEAHPRRVEHPHHLGHRGAQAFARVVIGDDDGHVEGGVRQGGHRRRRALSFPALLGSDTGLITSRQVAQLRRQAT